MRYKRFRQQEMKHLHLRAPRPDLYPVTQDYPWYGFSVEEGRIHSHLDGTMVGTHDYEQGLLKSMVDLE